MALGARNRAAASNRPPPAKTRLDEIKEKIKEQYAVHKAQTPPPSPEAKEVKK